MKKNILINNFGQRLSTLRKDRGLTQSQLAKLSEISPRMIAYYELHAKNIPAHAVIALAKSLNCPADELLGLKEFKHLFDPEHAILWKRFKKVGILSTRDQKALFHYLNALLEKPKYNKK